LGSPALRGSVGNVGRGDCALASTGAVDSVESLEAAVTSAAVADVASLVLAGGSVAGVAGALVFATLGCGASFGALGAALGDGASAAGALVAVCAKAMEEVASNSGPAARSATTEALGMANDPALSDPTRAARAVSHAAPISVKGAAAGPGTVIDDSAPIGCHHVSSQSGGFAF